MTWEMGLDGHPRQTLEELRAQYVDAADPFLLVTALLSFLYDIIFKKRNSD